MSTDLTDPINRLPVAVGNLLTRQRVKRKLTVEALATATGVSVADLTRIECGSREPTLREFSRIAQALGQKPVFYFLDAVAEWRGDHEREVLYKSRPSDFVRLYRLGYHHKIGDLREQPRAYDSMADATHAAAMLNAQRHTRGVALLDTVLIYVRLDSVFLRAEDNGGAQP